MTTTPKPKSRTKAKTNGDAGVGINVQLPTSLHRQLRVKAISNQQTLTDALVEAVRAWVKTK